MSSLFTPNSIACLTLLSVIFLVFIDIKSVPKEDLLTSLSLSSFKSPLTSVEDISYADVYKRQAYIIEKNPSILQSSKELQNIKNLLSVDELHVINKDGILEYSTIVSYLSLIHIFCSFHRF